MKKGDNNMNLKDKINSIILEREIVKKFNAMGKEFNILYNSISIFDVLDRKHFGIYRAEEQTITVKDYMVIEPDQIITIDDNDYKVVSINPDIFEVPVDVHGEQYYVKSKLVNINPI